jgi:flagellin
MALVLNTNINSLFAQNALNQSQQSLQTSLQRLSSGQRINSAADDATGLVTATNYAKNINGDQQAIISANNGISQAQIQDGYMQQLTTNLQRLNELAIQGGGTAVSNSEVTALLAENQRISALATGDTAAVISGSTGATSTPLAGALATLTDITGGTVTVGNVSNDLTTVENQRTAYAGDIATYQSAVNNMQTEVVNLSAAKSRVLDTDYAAETANMTKNQILQQAGTAMLAQANQLPNSILTLLK